MTTTTKTATNNFKVDTAMNSAEDNTATGTEVAENKKARKPYSINPVIDEDSPVKFNHVDICIENDVLKISGLFECKNIETAYRRFRKIMAQVATEVPKLEGWDEWEPAKKLTFDETEKIWLNENDEMIFDTKYTTNILNVDINEDTIYIWGTFYMTAEAYRAAHPEEPNFNYNTEATEATTTEAEENTAQVEETEEINDVEVKPTKKSTQKVDRLTELKGSKLLIYKAINNALRSHYVKLESGEFCDASEAGFTTIGVPPSIFDKLYFKDENGAYVEVSEKAIYAFNRLEVELSYIYKAIDAEIARTTVKFEVGKWYASDETDWNGDPYGTYHVLKRTKKFVTIYNPDIDDWHYIDNYDPDDEIDGEFDCIFRKKIQFDERGEYVDWRDDDGELVTLCAKDVTDKPVDEDPDDDDAEDDEPTDDAAEDNVEAESVNDEKPEHTAVEELNQPSKDDLRGSLERAAKIARQKYREYKREGDKAGMRHESELFEICTDAIKLEAA